MIEIDISYFDTPDCMLPKGAYNTISQHIARYKNEILVQLLGYDLAKLVLAYDEDTSEARIKNIVEGIEYENGQYNVKWNGLINSEKISIISYYAYIEYIKNYSITFQNSGTEAVAHSPARLIQLAGYRLRELAGYYSQDCLAPSLYNFLRVKIGDYPEWVFNEFKPTNMFGV
jgi:hypothetical protein